MAGDLDREALWVLCLDAKCHMACLSQVSLGTITSAPAHPREILKLALMSNANSIILVHNHPSGDPTPSFDDREITRQMQAAARTLGIKLHDHLIVGDGKYYSFADEGDL
jgi:DNA repair protein RadC